MAEENNELVNLGDLSSATSADVRKALEGQPNPVETGEDPVEQPTGMMGSLRSKIRLVLT